MVHAREDLKPREYRFAVDWDGTCVENRWPETGDWLPGAPEALRELDSMGSVVIHSCRVAPLEFGEGAWRNPAETQDEIKVIQSKLDSIGLGHIEVWTRPYKPPALVYIDDRAITFHDWSSVLPRVEMALGRERLSRIPRVHEGEDITVGCKVYGPPEITELDPDPEHFKTLLSKLEDEPETILQEADRLVSTDRQNDYGHPFDDFTKVSSAAKALGIDPTSSPEHHALYMVVVKLARETNRPKRDNRVDGAGYFKTLDMVIEERERREGS